MSGLSFAKEAVSGVQAPQPSLLSSTLASSAVLPAAAAADRAAAGGARAARAESAGVTSIRPAAQAYSVGHVIAAVVESLRAHAELELTADASAYDLRIADDDGGVDADFPPIDNVVSITGVGVDRFVLCETATDTPRLVVVVPDASLSARGGSGDGAAVAAAAAPLAALDVTASAVPGGAAARAHTVRVSYSVA